MVTSDNTTIWGIHGGKTGDADSLFLRQKCVAISFTPTPDLRSWAHDRESFKTEVAALFPQKKKGAIPNIAGQLFRFANDVNVGDLVVYPSKTDRLVHIGRVAGNYVYAADEPNSYPHRRKVSWLKSVPRTDFTQGALYEIGSAMSFFQVKNYAVEFHAILSGQSAVPMTEEDETIGMVAAEIEETTNDFILKTLRRELKGHPFEEFIAHLLGTMGYQTQVASAGADGGVDIIASKDELGFSPPIIKVQVKSADSKIGNPDVSALYGNVDSNEFGLLFALGGFTSQAIAFARNKSNLRLVDGSALVRMIFNHYEQFDAKYKGLIPLKRVYIPQPTREGEE